MAYCRFEFRPASTYTGGAMGKTLTKVKRGLDKRREYFDNMDSEEQKAHTRPGSRNPKKSFAKKSKSKY